MNERRSRSRANPAMDVAGTQASVERPAATPGPGSTALPTGLGLTTSPTVQTGTGPSVGSNDSPAMNASGTQPQTL
eukprot:6877716-Pyramimonas_sp.AAC.1